MVDRHGSIESSSSWRSSDTVRGPFRSRPPVTVRTGQGHPYVDSRYFPCFFLQGPLIVCASHIWSVARAVRLETYCRGALPLFISCCRRAPTLLLSIPPIRTSHFALRFVSALTSLFSICQSMPVRNVEAIMTQPCFSARLSVRHTLDCGMMTS